MPSKEDDDKYCKICPYPERCLYESYYAKNKNTNLPKRIRIDTPLKTRNFNFGIFLFDDGVLSLRFVLMALKRMLNTPTLTSHKYAFPQSDIFLNGEKVYFDNVGKPRLSLESFRSQKLKLNSSQTTPLSITIKFLSPCVIGYKKSECTPEEFQKKKKQIKKEITLKDLIDSIRFRKAYYETGERMAIDDYSINYTKIESSFHPVKIKKMKEEDPVIGVMGIMQVYDIDPESYEVLKLGEVIGAGKKTVTGAGKIKIEVLNKQ